MRPLAFARFNTKLGKPAPVTIRVLLDSGASEWLINAKYVKHLRVKKASKSSTVWSTPAGEMKTLLVSQVKAPQFTIPKLQEKKLLEWNLHVIIGRDIMNVLGINIQFSDSTVHWENASMPFKPVNATVDTEYHIAEPMAVEDTTEQIRKILDAKYQATDLEKVCSAQSHLEYQQQQKLFDLLDKFSDLFN
jgi:Aspartyl protease